MSLLLSLLLAFHIGPALSAMWGSSPIINSINTNNYSPRPIVYVERSKLRLIVYRGPVQECDLVGDSLAVQRHLAEEVNSTKSAVVELSKDDMSRLVRHCDGIHMRLFTRDPESYFVIEQKRKDKWDRNDVVVDGDGSDGAKAATGSLWSLNMFNRILIFPGTKWCGQGAVAEHYNDIGYHAEADRCCRDHDLCLTVTGEYMSPGHCKNGLCNFSPVTRSPCECDKAFVKCLRGAKTRIANALGRVFFNIAGLTCYKYDYPIKRCVEYVDVVGTLPARLPLWIVRALSIHPEPQRPRCRRYELDITKPKVWQFFETVYDDAHSNSIVDNARSEEPRSYGYHRRPNSLSLFQKIVVDLFMSFIDPM